MIAFFGGGMLGHRSAIDAQAAFMSANMLMVFPGAG
jgi:hypothetical protein